MRLITVKQYRLVCILAFISSYLFFVFKRLIVCGLEYNRIVCIHIGNEIFLRVKRLHNRLFNSLGFRLFPLRLALGLSLFYLSNAEIYLGMNLFYTLGKLLVNVFRLGSCGRSRLFRRSIILFVLIVTVIKIINIIIVGIIFIILVITLGLLLVNLDENDSNNDKHDKKSYKNHRRSALRLIILGCFTRLICGRNDRSLLVGYLSYRIKGEVSCAENDIVSFACALHKLIRRCFGICEVNYCERIIGISVLLGKKNSYLEISRYTYSVLGESNIPGCNYLTVLALSEDIAKIK